MKYTVRQLTSEDEPIVWRMLYEAAHLVDEGYMSVDAARYVPALVKYARDWGKRSDLGFAAYDATTLKPVGAAWIRLLTGEEKGCGYLDDSTPELAMGVIPEHRNKGVGTKLLMLLIESTQQRFAALSLSVRTDNPAVRLYRRCGFEPVAGSEIVNRVGGRSWTMRLTLSGMQPDSQHRAGNRWSGTSE
jgi:ribosomal protein S18 acetylase RimI-like enzyme